MNSRPMLATPSTGASGRRSIKLEDLVRRGWILDTKLDGVRAFNQGGRLWNREGVDITYRYPEIAPSHDLWLDGEIVAEDGTFETALLRDAQHSQKAISRLAIEKPCRFVAFDLLADPRHDFVADRTAYEDRRARLAEITMLGYPYHLTPTGHGLDFFERTRELKMEGVIAKRPGSRYAPGARSKDWVKFKHLHRITMVAVGYELGNGARSHFGSLKLALVGPDGPTRGPGGGWRVGSGFTERDTHQLKERLDDGDLFAVEIEVLNRTKDGSLRFPVFKGVRTDVAVHTCLVDQVDGLPLC